MYYRNSEGEELVLAQEKQFRLQEKKEASVLDLEEQVVSKGAAKGQSTFQEEELESPQQGTPMETTQWPATAKTYMWQA